MTKKTPTKAVKAVAKVAVKASARKKAVAGKTVVKAVEVSSPIKSKAVKKVIKSVAKKTTTIKLNALGQLKKALGLAVTYLEQQTNSPQRLKRIRAIKKDLTLPEEDFFATRFGALVLDFLTSNKLNPLGVDGQVSKTLFSFCQLKLLVLPKNQVPYLNLVLPQEAIPNGLRGNASDRTLLSLKAKAMVDSKALETLCISPRKVVGQIKKAS